MSIDLDSTPSWQVLPAPSQQVVSQAPAIPSLGHDPVACLSLVSRLDAELRGFQMDIAEKLMVNKCPTVSRRLIQFLPTVPEERLSDEESLLVSSRLEVCHNVAVRLLARVARSVEQGLETHVTTIEHQTVTIRDLQEQVQRGEEERQALIDKIAHLEAEARRKEEETPPLYQWPVPAVHAGRAIAAKYRKLEEAHASLQAIHGATLDQVDGQQNTLGTAPYSSPPLANAIDESVASVDIEQPIDGSAPESVPGEADPEPTEAEIILDSVTGLGVFTGHNGPSSDVSELNLHRGQHISFEEYAKAAEKRMRDIGDLKMACLFAMAAWRAREGEMVAQVTEEWPTSRLRDRNKRSQLEARIITHVSNKLKMWSSRYDHLLAAEDRLRVYAAQQQGRVASPPKSKGNRKHGNFSDWVQGQWRLPEEHEKAALPLLVPRLVALDANRRMAPPAPIPVSKRSRETLLPTIS